MKAQVSTDANGQYFLSNLPAGTYTVTAAKPGFSTGTASASVKAGKTSTVTLDLNDVQPPGAPNLKVDLITQTTARLVWGEPEDNTGIYRYYVYHAGGILRDVLQACYLQDQLTGLMAGTDYAFYVVAQDWGGNNSAPSTLVAFRTLPPDTTPPSVPAGLVASPWSGQVRLDWEPSTDQVGIYLYRVYRDGVFLGNASASVPLTHFDSDLPDANAYYRYEVSALDVAGNESARSLPAWGRAGPMPPGVLSVSPPNGTTVTTDRISVTGTVRASVTQVLVNGEPAPLSGGTYSQDVVRLAQGANAVEVQATNDAGETTMLAPLTITRAGDVVPVTLSAAPVSGAPPLTVQFTTTGALPQITKYQWDLDGDGTFETESPTVQARSHTYPSAGSYRARVRVLDDAGLAYGAVADVRVNLPPVASNTIAAQAGPGLAADPAGNLYAADVGGSVGVYDAAGSKVREMATSEAGSALSGVAVQADGTVFAVDRGTRQVRKFDGQGTLVASFGEVVLADPFDLAVVGGSVFVTDGSSGAVQVFDADGEHLGVLSGAVAGEGALSSPKGICTVDGVLYVADSGHHRVAVFSTGGAYLRAIGSGGTGEGQLASPSDVAWDPQYQQVLVADEGNGRIVAFDEEGQYVLAVHAATVGAPGVLGVAAWSDDTGRAVAVADAGKVTRARLPVPSPEAVWNQMKAALAARDVEAAVACFDPGAQDEYRKIFYVLKDQLPQIAADMGTVQHDYTWPDLSRYSIRKTEVFEGQPLEVTHTIHFVKDERGQWKIKAF